jgi:hypothetical protein
VTPLAVMQLVLSLEPALQELVTDVLTAAKTKDAAAERKAFEAAIVLQFEARKA